MDLAREIRGDSLNIKLPAGMRRVANKARPWVLVGRTSNAGGGEASSEEEEEDWIDRSSDGKERIDDGGTLVVVDVEPDPGTEVGRVRLLMWFRLRIRVV